MSISGILTNAGVELWDVENWDGGVTNEPDPTLTPLVQYYTHFDLTTEQLGRTSRYNCWGFTFLPRRYWINSSSCVDQILLDNCTSVPDGSLRRGDVIRYQIWDDGLDEYVTTHTGRVWEVDGAGHCTYVRSKWGGWAEYVHIPLDTHITDIYGTNLAYFRQHSPLKGIIGDLWCKDATTDNGNQYSGDTYWTSPDIVVDAPPYGPTDVNAAYGSVNRVWAVIHNRSQAAINNVMVRYYWANCSAGLDPPNWHLIPATAGHSNPTTTFSVPGYSDVTAPYVEWSPETVVGATDQAHQCLFAVVYVNDNPQDSSNPDPIVYPFDIPWDNNIAQRNVHVEGIPAGGMKSLTIYTGVPWVNTDKVTTNLRFTLNFTPRLPVFGVPKKFVMPQVQVAVAGQRPVELAEYQGKVEALSRVALMTEKTVAMKEIKKVVMIAKKPIPIKLTITAPKNARVGDNYYLNIEQMVGNKVTGGYTVIITITPK